METICSKLFKENSFYDVHQRQDKEVMLPAFILLKCFNIKIIFNKSYVKNLQLSCQVIAVALVEIIKTIKIWWMASTHGEYCQIFEIFQEVFVENVRKEKWSSIALQDQPVKRSQWIIRLMTSVQSENTLYFEYNFFISF